VVRLSIPDQALGPGTSWPDDLPPPPAHASLAEIAADWITARIISGDIQPGSKLPEVALAEAARMSRSPIREALRALAQQGLVDLSPRRAATVAHISREDAAELYECRMLLEPRCMALAARHAPADTRNRLDGLIDQMGKLAHEGNGHGYLDTVTKYGQELQGCCPNKMLASLTSAAQSSSLRYTAILVRSSQQYLLLSLANNRALHTAVQAADAAAIEQTTHTVLESARDQILALMDSIPQRQPATE
jgi:DNA-binding GntR family transcriptional regulator